MISIFIFGNYFYFILFYSISLIFLESVLLRIIFILFYSFSVIFFGRILLGLCQQSLIPFISRFPFHFVSSSNYKQIPIGTMLVAYKSRSPLSLYIYTNFLENFSKSFQRVFSYIYLEEFIQNPSCTHFAYRVHPRRDLVVESWRQTTSTLVHRVRLRGGWIYFKVSTCHASTDKFFFLFILFFVCVFWASFFCFHTLKSNNIHT